MKNLNLPFDEKEYRILKKSKRNSEYKTWREFFLGLAKKNEEQF